MKRSTPPPTRPEGRAPPRLVLPAVDGPSGSVEPIELIPDPEPDPAVTPSERGDSARRAALVVRALLGPDRRRNGRVRFRRSKSGPPRDPAALLAWVLGHLHDGLPRLPFPTSWWAAGQVVGDGWGPLDRTEDRVRAFLGAAETAPDLWHVLFLPDVAWAELAPASRADIAARVRLVDGGAPGDDTVAGSGLDEVLSPAYLRRGRPWIVLLEPAGLARLIERLAPNLTPPPRVDPLQRRSRKLPPVEMPIRDDPPADEEEGLLAAERALDRELGIQRSAQVVRHQPSTRWWLGVSLLGAGAAGLAGALTHPDAAAAIRTLLDRTIIVAVESFEKWSAAW